METRFIPVVTQRYTFAGKSYASRWHIADRDAANRCIAGPFLSYEDAREQADAFNAAITDYDHNYYRAEDSR